MTWYVKRRHYGGGESVIKVVGSEEEGQKVADMYNHQYQTDNYVVEPYDPAKVWVMPTYKERKKLLKEYLEKKKKG